ncbi:quinone oxidoreductase family protein [Actinomadura fibrosa]|uniref:Zinc-binding alcohol dehydrogenase family protein n=1 Tax=Actinomadura fibrosa TaxID=111802 RepID=A0ABW2XMN5_9ACTN
MLQYEEVDDPKAGEDQVVIAVEAAGIGYTDIQLRAGALKSWAPDLPLPFVAGHEVVGRVVDGDPSWQGRRVLAQSVMGGGYAELIAVQEQALVPLPDAMDAHEALALLTQGTVAVGLMETARVKAGETVLVEAASGGVGSQLVQLAKRAGTRVVAGVRGQEDADFARELGADAVVDLARNDWAQDVEGPVQVVFESVGGAVSAAALDLLEPTVGRMVLYGNITGVPHEIDTALVYQRALSILGFATVMMPPGRIAPLRARAFELAAAGQLKPVVGSVLPLAEAAAAHQRFEEGASRGKTVLIP